MIWNCDNLRLYYETAGDGLPVLLLHGWQVDHRVLGGCMEPVFQEAGREHRFQRFYPDLPGMGRTGAASAPDNADGLLRVLLRFIREAVGGGPFLLAGESYGGYLALGLLRAIPQQVKGCLFVCPCVVPAQTERTLPPFAVCRREGVEDFTASPDFAGFGAVCAVQTPRTWALYQRDVLAGLQLADGAFLDAFQSGGYAFSQPVVPGEFTCGVPALFLTGRQDGCVGYEDARALARGFSRADFLTLNGAGHNLQIDQEPLFQALAGNWLDRFLPD